MTDASLRAGARSLRRSHAVALLSLLAAVGIACERPVEAATGESPGDDRPRVTVALPLSTALPDVHEYVARTQAPDRVEIRARVDGTIVRAEFEEGDVVKRGDLLFVIDPRPYQVELARARAELARVKAEQVLARKNLERADRLRQAEVIAESEWDQNEATLAQLAAHEQVAEAAIAAAKLQLEHAHVRSPITGRVGRRLVTLGNLVGPSTVSPLTTVVSVDPLHVYLDVDEARALELPRNTELEVEIGFAGEEGFPHRAPLDFVDNHVDAGSGTVQLRAVVPNADGRLTDGMFARVRLPSGAPRPAMLVSDRAVATDQDRRFVWVIDETGQAEYRAVELGGLHDGLRVVRGGLGPDDRVVVRGLQRVRAGTPVNAELVAMEAVDRPSQELAVR